MDQKVRLQKLTLFVSLVLIVLSLSSIWISDLIVPNYSLSQKAQIYLAELDTAGDIGCSCDNPSSTEPSNKYTCLDGSKGTCADDEICAGNSVLPDKPCIKIGCGDNLCDTETGEDLYKEDTWCYQDCCPDLSIEKGDLNLDCQVNGVDWSIMYKNWSPASMYLIETEKISPYSQLVEQIKNWLQIN